MVTIRLSTAIHAPPERVFDLARSIDLHSRSLDWTREEPVAGRMSGLIGLHETVTWRAWHLGVRQRLTSRISAYDRPRYFQDVMVRAPLRGWSTTTGSTLRRTVAPCCATSFASRRRWACWGGWWRPSC